MTDHATVKLHLGPSSIGLPANLHPDLVKKIADRLSSRFGVPILTERANMEEVGE